MHTADFPIYDYPTHTVTDPNYLYHSLGSFWIQVFNEQGTIKGYTMAQAEEIIQRYMDLVEVVRAYSVEDVPIYHTERWYPIIIQRSNFGHIPLLFESPSSPDVARFGAQAATDPYYAYAIFKFGFPKTPISKVYTFDPADELAKFSVLTDRVINPSTVLVNEVDVKLNGKTLYFNKDLFTIDSIPKANLVTNDGTPQTFIDSNGAVLQDQIIILWAYNAQIDKGILFKNYGYLFDLKLKNDAFFKDVLKSVVNLYVDGPTIRTLRAVACAFLGVSTVQEKEEIIEELFDDALFHYIVTNKNTYTFDHYYSYLPEVQVGKTMYAGDQLVDAALYFDEVQSKSWWRNSLSPKVTIPESKNLNLDTYKISKQYPYMVFPSHLFLGNYQDRLIFKNESDLITMDAEGNIHFPVYGKTEDITTFHQQINKNKEAIAAALHLSSSVPAITLNPLDFLFTYFLKSNTALLKFNFSSLDQVRLFMSFYGVISDIMPKHVYMMFFFEFAFNTEVYALDTTSDRSFLSNSTTTAMPGSIDGSDATGKVLSVLNVLQDPRSGLLGTSRGVLWNQPAPPGIPNLVHEVSCNVTSTSDPNVMLVKDGNPSVVIPAGKSNSEVGTLLLTDFN